MKKLLIVLAVLVTVSVFAQAPQKMSYQAVIRNGSSALITSTTVGMQISILQGSAIGTPVYVETQTPTSNINGLVSLEIGTGITIDDFSTIDWSNGPYFIKTETDPIGGTNYTITGTSELLSVPYALHAKTAENIIGGISETDPVFGVSPANGITGADITNWNNKLDTEIDGSVTNELQAISLSNDTIYLSNGGFVKLPAGFNGQYSSLTGAPTNVSAFTNDAGYLTTEIDGSVTNELQVLSISNDTLYLSDGGFVKIPSANAWSLDGNTGTVDGANFIGTTDNVPLSFKVNNQKSGRIDQYLFNSFYGYQAGNSNTTGVNNTAIGYQSLFLNTTGHENVSIGNYSLYENTIGTANTALGYAAMNKNTSGGANTAIGYDALFYNTTGNENTATGRVALHFNTTGVWNTANGSVALMNNTTGNNNTSVGYGSLFTNTTGNNNTAIGWNAGNLNETGSGNVFLGYQAGLNETGSNKLYIANNSTNPPLIYGDFATGNIGLGNNNPSARLHIGSGTRVVASSDASIFLQSGNGAGSARDWKIYVPMTAGYLAFRDMGFDNLNNGMATDAMAIQWGTGNVGIGTTTPAAKLDVRGNAKFGATNMINIWEWDAVEKIGLDYNTANGDFNMRNPVAGKRLLGTISATGSWGIETTGGLEMVRITGSGNMGIGTTSPNAKLEVNGNLLFTSSATVSPAAGLYSLTVRAGDGPASGGTMTIRGGQAGSATGGSGGNLELQGGGNMPSGGAGYGNLGVAGAVNITGGMGYNSTGGNVSIIAGATSCWALGGAVHSDVTIRGGMNYAVADAASIIAEGGYVNGGCSGNSTGGNLILKAGVGQGAGQPGKIQMIGLPVYANNAAAIAGGLTAGSLYRTGADPDPVCVVH